MTYFTILHWLTLIFFLLLYILLVYLSKKEAKNAKLFWTMVFSVTLVIGMASVFSIFVLDKYTKKASIYNLKNSRLLNTEEMIIQGNIQNTGKFKIGKCTTTIRIVNNALGSGTSLTGDVVFTPKSWLNFDRDKQEEKTNVLEIKKVIATDLKPGEYKSFVIRFKYPSYFNRATIVEPKLDCR